MAVVEDCPGIARLQFSRVGSRTILQRALAISPLRLLAPRAVGGANCVYLASYGGGLVGGDALRLTVDVGPGARALITTQASTKVYRSPAGASQQVTAHIADAGLLAVLPDPIVCFSGSSFSQLQRYDLSRDASLVVVDWMTSGRHGCGERWMFDRYESRLDIRRDGRRVVYDGVLLSRSEGPLADRMGRFNVSLLAAVTGPLVSAMSSAIIRSIAGLPVEKGADLIMSAAPLGDDGALLRIAGLSVEQVGLVLRDQLRPLIPLLGDDLWTRKW